MKAFDADVQVFGFALPMVLPNDYSLSFGHTYVRPIAFRTDNIINYTNTPSVSLSKNIPLDNGDVISLNVGTSYSFSKGDTLEQAIADPVYYQFIEAVMQSNGLDPCPQPSNLQDSWSNMANLSYLKPLSRTFIDAKLCIFSDALHKGGQYRQAGLFTQFRIQSAYAYNEWVNFSCFPITWKFSDDSNVQSTRISSVVS